MSYPGFRKKQINWTEVEKLMSYHLTQKDVAHYFDMSVDSLERYCQQDNGITLADFWAKKKAMGRVKLRNIQFDIAQSKGAGAATMAIFLDKKLFPEDHLPPTPDNPPTPLVDLNHPPGLKSFNEFCIDAGYFEPFPKQIEMQKFGMHETVVRLLLGARGYGKTDYVTIMGVAYDIYVAYNSGKDMSEFTNLIITKSKQRNKAILEEIRTALEKNGVPLDKANSNEIRVAGLIGQDHSVEAITIKTSMRGRHPKRIIMDDPVTDEDVSEAMRKLVKNKYNEAMKLCDNILIIGQPAHAFDLYAELREIVKKMEVPHGQIPELDADLDAMKIAGVDQTTIEMSYHLRVPVSGSMPFAGIKYLDKFPVGESVMYIDPSEGGDYTALTVGRGYFNGIAVEGYAWQKAWYHCLGDIIEICKKLNVKKICFETNKFGNQPVFQIRDAVKHLQIGVVGKHSDSNKHAIIMNAGSYSDMIHLSKESMPIYSKLTTQYEAGSKFDDPPDSLARLMEWIGLIKGKE
jgi:hypothetical protein